MAHSDLQAAMASTLALVERLAAAQEAVSALVGSPDAAVPMPERLPPEHWPPEHWTVGDALLQRFGAMTAYAQLHLFPTVLAAEGQFEATLSPLEVAERLGRLGALSRPDGFMRQIRLRRDILDNPVAEPAAALAQLRRVAEATPHLLDAIADAVEYIYGRGLFGTPAPLAAEPAAAPVPAIPLPSEPATVPPTAVPVAVAAVAALPVAATAAPTGNDDHHLLIDYPEELPHRDAPIAAQTDPEAIVEHPLAQPAPPLPPEAAGFDTAWGDNSWGAREAEPDSATAPATYSAEAPAAAAPDAGDAPAAPPRDYGGWEYAEVEADADAQRAALIGDFPTGFETPYDSTPEAGVYPGTYVEPGASAAPAMEPVPSGLYQPSGWEYADAETLAEDERNALLQRETAEQAAQQREEARLAAAEEQVATAYAQRSPLTASGWAYSEDEGDAMEAERQAAAEARTRAALTPTDREGYGGSAGNEDPNRGWEYAAASTPAPTPASPPPPATEAAEDDSAGAYDSETQVGSFDWALNRMGAGRRPPARGPGSSATAPFYPNYLDAEDPNDPASEYETTSDKK